MNPKIPPRLWLLLLGGVAVVAATWPVWWPLLAEFSAQLQALESVVNLLTGAVLLLIFIGGGGWWLRARHLAQAAHPDAHLPLLRQEELILLRSVRAQWVEGILKGSLYHQVLELQQQARPEAVLAWRMCLQLSEEQRQRPLDQPIAQTFADTGRFLLILGEPGGGKTITLLHLARSLLKIAETDPAEAIPVVLNLSSWAHQRLTLTDWMAEEMSRHYRLPREQGQAWLANKRILPLLDGLDEVAPAARAACVDAINAAAPNLPGLVVCCRHAEYETLPRLRVNGAVFLLPLTEAQIEEYLGPGGRQAHLRDLLRADAELKKLAHSPLMLNVMSLVYHDAPPPPAAPRGKPGLFGWFRSPPSAPATPKPATPSRADLWDRYVVRMLERRGEHAARHAREETLHWLRFLAHRLQQHGDTLFQLENLQASWLASPAQRWGVAGLAGLVVGLVFGLVWGLEQKPITPAEALSWSWTAFAQNWRQEWKEKVFVALVSALVGGLVLGLVGGLVGGLVLGLIEAGLGRHLREDKTRPNQGIHWTLRNAVLYSGVWGVVGLLLGAGIQLLKHGALLNPFLLIGSFVIGLVVGFLFFGGEAVIRHYSLRAVLWWAGYTPLHYARFLDDAADKILLRKVGGGYVFLHRMLLEHLAAQWEDSQTHQGAGDRASKSVSP